MLVFAGLSAAGCGGAGASPWNRPAGEGLVVFDYSLGAGTDYFDSRGHLAPAQTYGKGEIAAYVEYGATDTITLLARPSLDDVHVGAPDAGAYRGLGATAAGAQWQALVFGPAVLAVQGTFSLPGSTESRNPALVGNTCDRQKPVAVAGIMRDLTGLDDLSREEACRGGKLAVGRVAGRQDPVAKAWEPGPQGRRARSGLKARPKCEARSLDGAAEKTSRSVKSQTTLKAAFECA